MKGHPFASAIVSWLVIGAVGGLIINATVKPRLEESKTDFEARKMAFMGGVGVLSIGTAIASYYSNK